MTTTAYCSPTDLLLGDTQVGKSVDVQQYVDQGAEEIDMLIGDVYVTPVDLTALTRPGMLLLKRCNILITSGRLLMAVASGSDRVNAYGASLLQEGVAWLKEIADGSVLLDGATKTDLTNTTTGPTVTNLDSKSAVEVFYKDVMPTAPAILTVVPTEAAPVPSPGSGAYGFPPGGGYPEGWAPDE